MKNQPMNDGDLQGEKRPFGVVSASSQGARDYQEDALGHWWGGDGRPLFVVVADGAGGHGGGAEAAAATIASAAATWEGVKDGGVGDAGAFLGQWMKDAHLAVNEASAKIQRSGRAVVVACWTDGRKAYWDHAGDSRLLRFHGGKLVERTRDDSVVQILFERGEVKEEEMGKHPDQSRLLQSLGGKEFPSPRSENAEVEAGDGLILCTDGFWEHLSVGELEALMATPVGERQGALDRAVAEAVSRGGEKADNTTATLIHFGEVKGGGGGVMRWVILALIGVILGCLGGWMYRGKAEGLWGKMGLGGEKVEAVVPVAFSTTEMVNGKVVPVAEPKEVPNGKTDPVSDGEPKAKGANQESGLGSGGDGEAGR